MLIATAPAQVEHPATTARTARHYSAGYFAEVEAHWGRMIAVSPTKLMHFGECLKEGANCVRIAGYDRARFRTVFAKIATQNDLVSMIGGSNALQTLLEEILTLQEIDRLLALKDRPGLGQLLQNKSQEELAKIEAYIQGSAR